MNRFHAYLKKDGWIIAALIFCVLLGLLVTAEVEDGNTDENRLSRILGSIQGAGKVEVSVYYEDTIPCGAVIVADGADKIAVQLRLRSAVTTLLGIDQARIAVYEREGHE